MLHDFSPRPYQTSIFNQASKENLLVVLPTGLGKTAIAMMLAAKRLLVYPGKKILFLAPTKPLVEQHAASFKKQFFISDEQIVVFTGSTPPAKRHEQWKKTLFVFSTPQTIENDLLGNKLSLEDVVLLIIDEAHRATGDYAYVYLAEKYVEQAIHQRILALTASPGTDRQKIIDVTKNLHVDAIEYKKATDADVSLFTQTTKVKWEEVELPKKLQNILLFLRRAYTSKLEKVKHFGFLQQAISSYSKTGLLKLQQELHARISKSDFSPELLQSISLLAESLKVQHAIELAETQTVYALHEYLYNILASARSSKTKAIKNLSKDPNFLSALSLARDLLKDKKEHPKVEVLQAFVAEQLRKQPNAKILIFTQYRDTALRLEEYLQSICSTSVFFGQQKKNGVGFSQKKQKEILDKFRNNEFTCLIATSVAEEGLDIPSVNHVFFYEPVPSAIRTVQRRGRTGRHTAGFVTIFVAKGTRDEVHRWVSFHREKQMYKVLDELKKDKSLFFKDVIDSSQKGLLDFSHSITNKSSDVQSKKIVPKKDVSQIKIVVDYREKGSPVIKALTQQNISLELKQLSVGDFVISRHACIEYKRINDFVDSIVDGRLLSQLRSLSQYTKPVLIIEGLDDFSQFRKVDISAIHGMIATIALSYRIPIIRTSSPLETAKIIFSLARKEQEEKDEPFTYHTAKPLTKAEILEYVVSSLPGVGGAVAKALLDRFDTIKNILIASKEELKSVDLVGEKKVESIQQTFSQSYKQAKEAHKKDVENS